MQSGPCQEQLCPLQQCAATKSAARVADTEDETDVDNNANNNADDSADDGAPEMILPRLKLCQTPQKGFSETQRCSHQSPCFRRAQR